MAGSGVLAKGLIFIVFLCVILAGIVVLAAQKRCPVCHEVFDSKVEVCPNDGTDLKLLGASVEEVPDDTQHDDDKRGNHAVDSPGTGAESGGGTAVEHKYIRQDRGGRRKRAQPTESPEGRDERTDRQRRLQDERAGAVAVKKREPQADFSYKEDDRLRRRYEKLRRKSEKNRKYSFGEDAATGKQDGLTEIPDGSVAPLMSIGGRLSWMGEAKNPGPVTGAEIDLNLLRGNIRMGLSSFIGIRHISRNEMIFLESITVGMQYPWRFAPYILGRFGVGVIVSRRFGYDVTELVRGFGFDAGVDCRVSKAFIVTPSVGYVRYGISEATWDSVSLKIAIGF